MNKNFTIIIFAEANVGSIVRITTMISRRLIEIESLHVTHPGAEGIYRFVMTINNTEEAIKKLVLQIDKQVDVFKTFYHTDADLVWLQQDAYYQNELSLIATPGSVSLIGCAAV